MSQQVPSIRPSADVFVGSPRWEGAGGDSPDSWWPRLVREFGPATAASVVQGDFAVAFANASGCAFLAVDRFAMRSLCYRVIDGRLHWSPRASDLADPATDLEPQALFDYFYFHVIPSPRTVFRGVHRLPPGHYASFENGRLTVAPYWTARFEHRRDASVAALGTEFKRLLRQAVRRQLQGQPGACFLSGGTDSSTVAGMVGEVTGKPAATYSIGFEAEGYDEMHFARVAARHFGCEHHEYYVTPEDLVASIPKVAAAYDQPFGNSSALPAYYCALKARADGHGRMLAGDGGDELFGGNSRYASQKVFDIYQRVPGFVRTRVLEPVFGLPFMARAPLLRKGSSYIRQANTRLPDRLQEFNLLRRQGYARVLTPALLAQVRSDDAARQQREVWAQGISDDELDLHLAYDWRYTLAECDLPKVVGTTALAGVEVGFPMLDDDLLAFSMRLPGQYKVMGQQLRWFFKEALRGWLPDEIINKKKQGFGLPFGVWVMRHDRLKALAVDALEGTVTRGIVNPSFARELLDQRMHEAPGYYGTMLWILMMLEHWLRAHAPAYRLR